MEKMLDEELKKSIQNVMDTYGGFPQDVLEEQLAVVQNVYNNTGQDRFDGLSPEQMRGLLYGRWGENLITINPKKFDGNDIPMIKQIKYFLNIVKAANEIKLTKIGNLPPAVVKDIYAQGFIPDTMIDLGITKLTKETDVNNIVMTKILCKISGLIKIGKNSITLTKRAEKIINSSGLFEYLFDVTCNKYNWAYFDYSENEEIGQLGYNYTLYLINKYGNKWRDEDFYADLYFKAFDYLKECDKYFMIEGCYINRTLNQIMKYYGLIEYENKKLERGNIRKTELFEKYIKVGMYLA
ncbi:MAG: hypothetical protein LBH51_09880 [Treponema sp.]|jgi:hypothetical protein|nr:hypothetical protein [Treponema sp.]